MATFPKVRAGQPFKPSASLENHVREMVNSTFTISGGRVDKISSSVRINVYNCSDTVIPVGCAVVFTSIASLGEGDVIPCLAITDIDSAWGVLASTLEPNEIGSCIVSGPVKVKIDNGEGDFVQPDPNNLGVFVLSSKGVPVIFKHNGEAIINLGGGSGGATSHQFEVIDSSEVSADGKKTLRVSVVNGHAPGNVIAGYVNNISYSRTDIPLTGGLPKYYIYAIDGKIYALGHTFSCDLFPVLLLATVDIVDGRLQITQESFADNVIVPVAPKTLGATTLTCELSYNDYSLTAAYYVEASCFVNSTELSMAKTAIPESEPGMLYAYIKDVIVDPDTTPEAGFAFAVPEGAEFSKVVLEYSLNDSNFAVTSRAQDMYFFTFTRLYLNAAEAGE